MEVIDSQAREDIGKVWFRIGLVETVLWGVDKTNGLKSEVLANTKAIQTIRERLQHYIDAEREETCVGMREFRKRDEFAAEISEEVTEVKVAEINANAHKDVGKLQATVSLIKEFLVLAGIVFIAVMQVVPK